MHMCIYAHTFFAAVGLAQDRLLQDGFAVIERLLVLHGDLTQHRIEAKYITLWLSTNINNDTNP